MEKTYFAEQFDGDEYNLEKSRIKHNVSYTECEEAFFDNQLKILPDIKHSKNEKRHLALGKTMAGRGLFIVFTERGDKLRVISARSMSRKERKIYNEKT